MTHASWLPSFNCVLAAPTAVCALALLPTVLWGLTPVLVKRGLSRGGTTLQALVVILAADASVLWAVTLLIYGPTSLFTLSPAAVATFAFTGILGTAIGRLVVYAGIDRLGAAINTACLGTRPLFAATLGILVLNEHVGALTVAGVAVLTTGLIVLGVSKGGDVSGWEPRDLAFPLAGAGIYATANVARRFGLQTTGVPPIQAVTVNETVALAVVLGYVWTQGRAGDLGGVSGPNRLFALAGALTAIGMVSVFSALGHPGGRVVFIDPLLASAPLFATVFTYVLLRDTERITRGIVIGTTVIVAGAILVIVG